MPWCPKCGSEYREGFTVCADCKVPLVDERPSESDLYMEDDHSCDAEEIFAPELLDDSSEAAGSYSTGAYQDSKDKANDNRSSAWLLLIMGIVGLIVVGACITGIIPIHFGNSVLFYGVMIFVFIMFIFSSIISFKNATVFEKKAETENTLRTELIDWCKNNLNAAEIDQIIGAAGESAEILYFKRFSFIKAKMNHQFMNLDQAFLDQFIDEYVFTMLYEDHKE